jgi:hypothetical protein
MVDRVNVARSRAVTTRIIAFVSYAFICALSLGAFALTVTEYTAQYVHLHFELILVAALGGCAINQCAKIHLRRRSRATKVAAYVVPSPKLGGVVQHGHGRETK